MDSKFKAKKWLEMAEYDLATAKHLFKIKNWLWCMFISHLAVEKILKSYIVKTIKNNPPYIHDLERLAKIAGIDLIDDDKKLLRKLTKAQIAARYESYKQHIMQEFSPEFVSVFFPEIINFYQCIKKKI